MSTVPQKPVERIQFYENHIAPWTTNAVAIGLSAPIVSDIDTKTTAARAAYDAYQVSKEQTANLYVEFTTAMDALSRAGASALKKIRGQAEQIGGTSVYTLAVIPPPSTPESRGNPGTPRDFTAMVESTGALTVKFKNSDAAACVYNVWRKIGTADFQFVIGVARKKFTDTTVPAGTAEVEYQVQAVRSSGVSGWAPFTVKLGVAANGLPQATVSEQPAKAAA